MDLNNLLKSQWDRAAAIASSAVGAIFLLVGWIGVSGSAFLAEQAPYILSGGVGGIFFLGLGATLWISADLRDEWRKLDRIEEALKDGTLRWNDDADDFEDDDYGYEEQAAPRAKTARSASPRRAAGSTRVKSSGDL